MTKATELLRELLNIPSPSGEERQIGLFLAKRLKRNFLVKLQKVGNRPNIFAVNGKPKIVLAAHLDTVPGKLELKEDKKYIYGRGACDTKASIASMVIAAEMAVSLGLNNFGLLFDVSEETDFKGVKRAVKSIKPEFVIVGEPTKLKVVTGQKGLLGFKIIARGKTAHGSTPEKGCNAIELLLKDIEELKAIRMKKGTTINIGEIMGGKSANVVPDYAEATVEIRTMPEDRNLFAKIREEINDVRLLYDFKPKRLDAGNLPERFRKGITVPYFTEMYFWKNAIVIGPGNPAYAHSENERVSIMEVEKAVGVYLKLLKNYLNIGQQRSIL
ncbi:MAG TPA: M20 family metallopeptidase [Nanoarchaeota archaeon]|nr:M20 family metallopeptidase [Nanoarchaeota archaeon]